jgi:hypothetical protein
VAKQYKKPDLNAPRYRPKKFNLTNVDFYNKFIEDNPKYSSLTINDFKNVIKTFNGFIWKAAIDERDGVQLPEQLGYLFIGSCSRKTTDNTDYKKSEYYGVKIQNQNWESDQFVAKIFYTNFETKYRFKNHDLWGFTGLRDFKRSVAKTYPTEWKKYVQVDNLLKISRLFRIEKFKQFKTDETAELLKNYDEFNLE